jgi:biopolymer transport protein TolR
MVPFIDVMLVLLVIFMVTAPLITPSLINLPQVGKAAAQPQEVVQVEIDQAEAITVKMSGRERSVDAETMVQAVQELQNSALQGRSAADLLQPDGSTLTSAMVPVVISAEKSIKYETVIRVMDLLQRAGMQRVGLSVQIDTAGSGPVTP